MRVSHTILCLFLTAAMAPAGLLEEMGIDSDASRLVKEQNYRPQPPKQKPAQHASAEGVPPLPLPVVPLRRTEKKNPPRPPVLIGKIATDDYVDWATAPEDANNLMRWMAKNMNVHFSAINVPLREIPSDPKTIPVLYRSGIKAFEFSAEIRQRLRQYLLAGGTLILNAYCGHPDFARSAMIEMQQLLPERPPYRLTADHPLYSSYNQIESIRYRPLALEASAQNNVPSTIGIDIDTRTAVFFFRYDVSSGWDDMPEGKRHCIGYEAATAHQLGANLMAYVTAERNAGVPLAKSLEFVDANEGVAGKFTIAQARYDGLWRTRTGALAMLLNVFHQEMQAPVRFETASVDLDSPRLYDSPFVYLTGQMDFRLKSAERANLRQYLLNGGFLLVEATCGRPSFDRAFRRELHLVLPDARLEQLPEDHLLFSFPRQIKSVTPRPALASRLQVSTKIPPLLYGVRINGNLAVVYSPIDLAGGWSMAHGPYNAGIEASDALALGVNILSYALLQ